MGHSIIRRSLIAVVLVTPIFTHSPRVCAQTVPDGFTLTQVVSHSSLYQSTSLAVAPDGRVFIGVKQGTIRIWKPEVGLLPTPFHTFSASSSSETGLIGMALDPDFASNGYIYVQYNAVGMSPQKVVRISTSTVDPDISDPASEFVLLSMDRPSGIHNAGGLRFGVDGKLYVSVGEKSTQSSQSLTTLFGKILRLNRDGTIPDDNPTQFDGVSGSPEGIFRAIWAIGFRNPFRFAIHPRSGRMLVNDVSSSNNEEIDDVLPGRNYGFPEVQGMFDPVAFPNYTLPKFTYRYDAVGVFGNCIIGSTFYSPDVCTFPPEYFDEYFFGDLSTHTFRVDAETWETKPIFGNNLREVTDMQVDSLGRLWALQLFGRLWRFEYTEPLPPVVVREPEPQFVCGGDVTFRVVVSGSLPITYTWQRNNQTISDGPGVVGTNTRQLTINTDDPTNAGSYCCVIRNAHGETVSEGASFAVGPMGAMHDGQSIGAFVEAVLAGSQEANDVCAFDFDGSGRVEAGDVDQFVAKLISAS